MLIPDGRQASSRADASGKPATDQDDQRDVPAEPDADGGDKTKADIQLPGVRDLGRQGQTDSQDSAPGQDGTPRSNALRHGAEERANPRVNESKDREGAGGHATTPAKFLEQRDQEDGVAVPESVE